MCVRQWYLEKATTLTQWIGWDMIYPFFWGYKRVILKSDQEPAIKKLKATVRKEYSLEIPEEQSAVGDSQGNGAVERTCQRIHGMVRTLKRMVEARCKVTIASQHAAF